MHDRDRMHGVGAPYRLGPRFAQAQGADLALLDQLGHRSDRIFDRHVRVDAVLVVEIDDIDAQAPKARLTGDRNIFGTPIGSLAAAAADIAEFCRQNHLGAPTLDGLADEFLIMAVAVGVRRIEQRDAAIQRLANDGNAGFVIAGAIGAGKRHAAEPDSGRLQPG